MWPECDECEELVLLSQYYCSVLGHSPPLPEVGGVLLRSERPVPHVRVPESSPQGVALSDVAQR